MRKFFITSSLFFIASVSYAGEPIPKPSGLTCPKGYFPKSGWCYPRSNYETKPTPIPRARDGNCPRGYSVSGSGWCHPNGY